MALKAKQGNREKARREKDEKRDKRDEKLEKQYYDSIQRVVKAKILQILAVQGLVDELTNRTLVPDYHLIPPYNI